MAATRTPTKGLNETDSEFNQYKTILESDQEVTDTGLILNSSQMVRASREATREAISSSRGIVVYRIGATLAFSATRRTSVPFTVGLRR